MAETQLERLYAVADDGETAILDDLSRRAGLTWDCPPGGSHPHHPWTCVEAQLACDHCGRARDLAEV